MGPTGLVSVFPTPRGSLQPLFIFWCSGVILQATELQTHTTITTTTNASILPVLFALIMRVCKKQKSNV